MATYTLTEPVHFDGEDRRTLERFELDLQAGDFRPRNEREEQVLEELVSLGVAMRKRKGKED